MVYRIATVAFAMLLPCAAFAQLNIMPVHDTPRWKVVQSLPQAQGAAIAVSSLSTNQVIGQIRPDEKFLSFGSDGQVVTMAFNGTIGYIPATAVRDLYPIEEPVREWRAYGRTLQELAEAEANTEKDLSKISLRPRKKEPASGAAGGVPGAAMDPGMGYPAVTAVNTEK